MSKPKHKERTTMTKLLAVFCAAMGIAAFGEATKYVKSNETVDITDDLSVDQFSVEAGTLVKDGEGTLEIGAPRLFSVEGYGDAVNGLNITINNGAITTKGPLAPIADDTLADKVLARAYVHYDASVVESVETNENGIITAWKDLNGKHDAIPQCGTPTNRIDELNGLNVVDCCTFGLNEWGQEIASDRTHFSYFLFDRTEVKTGFVIFKDIFAWAEDFVIGDTGYYYFHRQGNALIANLGGPNMSVVNGEWHIDGKRANHLTYQLGTDYHLASFRLHKEDCEVNPIYVSAICRGPSTDRIGGARVAEIAYFDEFLTDDEIRAVEEKLLRKWFDKPHPAEVATSLTVDTLTGNETAGGCKVGASVETPVTIAALDANGVFTKEGDGEVTISAFKNLSGVSVQDGSAVLKGGVGDLLAEAFMHFDASDASTITTNAEGGVERVESANGNGRYMTPAKLANDFRATLQKFGDYTVMDFGGFNWYGPATAGLAWSERCTSPREIFVVCYRPAGSNQFLLSDVTDVAFYTEGWSLVHPNADATRWSATWHINDYEIDPTQVNFTNELAVYSVTDIQPNAQHISRLASDRDSYDVGGMQYGEVIVYDHPLTDEKREEIRNYLLKKWTSVPVVAKDAASFDVNVEGGARFVYGADLDAKGKTLSIGANADGVGQIMLGGTLLCDATTKLELNRDSAADKPVAGTYKLLETGDIDGVENLELTGSLVGPYNCTLSVEGGTLYATIRPSGMMIIIR